MEGEGGWIEKEPMQGDDLLSHSPHQHASAEMGRPLSGRYGCWGLVLFLVPATAGKGTPRRCFTRIPLKEPVLPACHGATLPAGALGGAPLPTPVYSPPNVWPSLLLSVLISKVAMWWCGRRGTGKPQARLVKMASAGSGLRPRGCAAGIQHCPLTLRCASVSPAFSLHPGPCSSPHPTLGSWGRACLAFLEWPLPWCPRAAGGTELALPGLWGLRQERFSLSGTWAHVLGVWAKGGPGNGPGSPQESLSLAHRYT